MNEIKFAIETFCRRGATPELPEQTGRDHAAGTAYGLRHENDFWDANYQGLSCYYSK